MGQTLTHGVYLPDEGERNCYSGLAANWQILDSSAGTIAEHTSALLGKAPLVHTHTKSDITDFPVYGTTAVRQFRVMRQLLQHLTQQSLLLLRVQSRVQFPEQILGKLLRY